MVRLLLSGFAAIALVVCVLVIDRGSLGSKLEALVTQGFGNSNVAPIVGLFIAATLAIIGASILGGLLWLDRSPRAAIKRRVLIRSIINVAWFLGVQAALGSAVIYLEGWDLSRGVFAQLFFSGFLAGAVGFGELIQRYKDNPHHLMASAPTAIYVCVNAAAGIGALALIKHFDVFSAGPNKGLYEVLLAGFGAIAFFRTSFFTAKVGDADVGIGPATLLKSLLDSSDMMTDREQAVVRGETIATVMLNVDFEKAQAALPALCFTLVEGASPDQQHAVGLQVAKLGADPSMSPKAKAGILGAYLIRQVGAQVLSQAVDALGDEITKSSQASTTGIIPDASTGPPAHLSAAMGSVDGHPQSGNHRTNPEAADPSSSSPGPTLESANDTKRNSPAGPNEKAGPH